MSHFILTTNIYISVVVLILYRFTIYCKRFTKKQTQEKNPWAYYYFTLQSLNSSKNPANASGSFEFPNP